MSYSHTPTDVGARQVTKLWFTFFNFQGPYKVNGVPLRRVPQSYVIATQTKIDISKVNLSDKVNDTMFKRAKKTKRSSDAMFEESAAVSID